MYQNVYFWLGEIGLILQIISCAVLLHSFRTKKWIEILPFFFFLIMALTMLARPAIIDPNHSIPPAPYLYRLSVGIVFASRAFFWRSVSILKDKQMMDKIWQWLALAAAVFLLFLGYRIKGK